MLNIAIDGPCGSGKSTVADILAEKLDILHLDTGAMYRACALAALKRNIDCLDENAVSNFIKDINLVIRYEDGKQITILDGEDVSQKIRENQVSMMSSNISSLGSVREKMVEMQQQVAKQSDCILDGRDIGTVVLPNAKYKFYITASPEIRAERRYKELLLKGSDVKYEDVLNDVNKRDYNDSHRAISPLKKADDAIVIDTSYLSAIQVVGKITDILAQDGIAVF